MKIAYFSDLHGNLPALDALLREFTRLGVDRVICGGDAVNPLWTSNQAIDRLEALGIEMLRGNHEDYIWRYFFDPDVDEMRTSPRWLPIRHSAEKIGPDRAERLHRLPLSLQIEGRPGAPDSTAFFCHASPLRNFVTPMNGIDARMAEELDSTRAAMVVSGHWHMPWSSARLRADGRPQLLAASGSAGFPLCGSKQAEFLLVTYGPEADGLGWSTEARTVAYDFEAAIREFRDSGALSAGGPVAWCLFDELLANEKRLGPFMAQLRQQSAQPATLSEWETAVTAYLRAHGRWDAVRAHLT